MELNPLMRFTSKHLAKHLTKTVSRYQPFSVHRSAELAAVMQPGDILLVEGDQRVSAAIKYLTQSTWSHAAFYIDKLPGSADGSADTGGAGNEQLLIEADLQNGVITVPLSKYSKHNIRICRPLNLSDEDKNRLCKFMVDSLGMDYDLKNIIDLARFLLPNPPVPRRWRRRMLALGSGDPTRAICSSLIAQAFQSIQYPILPDRICAQFAQNVYKELMHIRHHSLFAPRDFDISPYFEIVKPELQKDFDYRALDWHQHTAEFLASGHGPSTRDAHHCQLEDAGAKNAKVG